MRCAERPRPGGGACRREATALAVAGTLLAVLCAECAVRAAARVPGLIVRWQLRRPAPGHGAGTALTCTT